MAGSERDQDMAGSDLDQDMAGSERDQDGHGSPSSSYHEETQVNAVIEPDSASSYRSLSDPAITQQAFEVTLTPPPASQPFPFDFAFDTPLPSSKLMCPDILKLFSHHTSRYCHS